MNPGPGIDELNGLTPGENPVAAAPDQTAAAKPMQPGEVCVPTSALAEPGEDEQMNNPQPGDIVEGRFEGKVTRVEGDQTYFIPTSVNGQELGGDQEQEDESSPEDQGEDASELSQLESQAGQMDKTGGSY